MLAVRILSRSFVRQVVRQTTKLRHEQQTRCGKCAGVRVFSTEPSPAAYGVYKVDAETKQLKLSPSEWMKRLTEEQYYITREKGTEAPFSGEHVNNYEEGIYSCVCCGTKLFESKTKFNSGTGWPSFYAACGSENSNVMTRQDSSHNMVRTEAVCRKCDAHLGHVFNDGPPPTGKRYCINSVSLNFTPQK